MPLSLTDTKKSLNFFISCWNTRGGKWKDQKLSWCTSVTICKLGFQEYKQTNSCCCWLLLFTPWF